MWDTKTSDTKSNHLKIIQKIHKQYTGKAQHQGATDNHTGHCNIFQKVQKI